MLSNTNIIVRLLSNTSIIVRLLSHTSIINRKTIAESVMLKEELFEKLRKLLDELIECNRTIPVVVEGIKDVKALRSLGLEGEIISLNQGERVFTLTEALSREHSEIIILTDWDRTGGHLCRLLREGFESNGVKHNVGFRSKLVLYTRHENKDIEGLPGFMDRLMAELGRIPY